jgi:hypothetical protein
MGAEPLYFIAFNKGRVGSIRIFEVGHSIIPGVVYFPKVKVAFNLTAEFLFRR